MVVAWRCWVEGDPTVAWEKDFHPTVRVARANDVIAAHVVVLAGKKAVHVARGNSERSHHHRHGGGKIFAMAGALLKKEIRQRIDGRRTGKIERITVVSAQVAFHRARFVIGIDRTGSDRLRQSWYA